MRKRRKKRRKRKPSRPQKRWLRPEEINITREAQYIIHRAQNYEARLVVILPFVFFSTETGDAWLLELEDNLALCLARDGEEQTFTIHETADDVGIDWPAAFRIDGAAFTVVDRSGHARTILGYPTQEILRVMGNLQP